MTIEPGGAIAGDADNVASMIDAFGLMIRKIPGATVDETGGVSSFFAHVPLGFFNMSILNRPMRDEAEFRRALDLAGGRARACAYSSFIGLLHAWAPANADEIIAETGLAPALKVTGMAVDSLLPSRRAAPDLEYRLAGAANVAEDLGAINAAAYGMPAADFACVAEPGLWTEQSFGVVGYAAGRAVSATASFVVADIIYVAYVATLPDAYGRGYAEAVMRRSIAEAQAVAGPKRIWLHATEMGAPLYRSMGFEAGASLPLYALAT